MSATTNISWCDSTVSPWFGCSEVSAGCAFKPGQQGRIPHSYWDRKEMPKGM